jgi:hypothetical protein
MSLCPDDLHPELTENRRELLHQLSKTIGQHGLLEVLPQLRAVVRFGTGQSSNNRISGHIIPQLPGTQGLQAVQRVAVGRGEQILKLLRWSWSVPGEQARNASVYVEQARRWCSPRPSWTKLNHAPRSATPSPTGNCRQGPTRAACTAKLMRCLPFIILQLSY